MTVLFADIEANGLTPTVIHCLVVKEKETGDVLIFRDEDKELCKLWLKTKDKVVWVFHNGLGYDVKWLNKLWDLNIDPKKVVDTSVISRMVDFNKYRPHSLETLGAFVGEPKSDYSGGWDHWSQEMEDYCKQDVIVTEKVFDYFSKYIMNPNNKDAIRLEHDMAIICQEMGESGFPFDVAKAKDMLADINKEMEEIENKFRKEIPSARHEVKRLKHRFKKDGTYPAVLEYAMRDYPDYEVVGDEVVFYEQKHFDPASPKQRIDMLWDAGWQPVDKTKGHIEWERSTS